MMMTGKSYGVTMITENGCVCGSTQDRKVHLILLIVCKVISANFNLLCRCLSVAQITLLRML